MNWFFVLFFLAAIAVLVWNVRSKVRYFGGVRQRAAAEFRARQLVQDLSDPTDPSSITVPMTLTPKQLAALDRFIAQSEPMKLDRSHAAKVLMVEGLVRLQLLTPYDKIG